MTFGTLEQSTKYIKCQISPYMLFGLTILLKEWCETK